LDAATESTERWGVAMKPVDEFRKAIQYVKDAEKLAAPGTYQYDLYVKAALMSSWPIIKAFADVGLTELRKSD
jgi:hypothetical protein